MRVHVVSAAAPVIGHPLSTFVIDEVLAVDAGGLGWWQTPQAQARIRDVLLTHAHLDHIAGLPTFLENVYLLAPEAPTIHGSDFTLAALQTHLFNDVLMPDFVALSRQQAPFLKLATVPVNHAFQIGNYEITAWEIDHIIPTLAYTIDDGVSVVAIVTDTVPVPLLSAELARCPRLKAVFLEASFPNRHRQLAAVSKHCTSAQFLETARQFPAEIPIIAVHVKMRFFDEVSAELLADGLPNVQISKPGQIIEV